MLIWVTFLLKNSLFPSEDISKNSIQRQEKKNNMYRSCGHFQEDGREVENFPRLISLKQHFYNKIQFQSKIWRCNWLSKTSKFISSHGKKLKFRKQRSKAERDIKVFEQQSALCLYCSVYCDITNTRSWSTLSFILVVLLKHYCLKIMVDPSSTPTTSLLPSSFYTCSSVPWKQVFERPASASLILYLAVLKAPYIIPCAFLVSTKAIFGCLNRNTTTIRNLKTQHWQHWIKSGQINSSSGRKIFGLIQFLSIGKTGIRHLLWFKSFPLPLSPRRMRHWLYVHTFKNRTWTTTLNSWWGWHWLFW